MLYKVHEQKIRLLYTYITMLSVGKRHHTSTIKEVTSYHTVINRAETTQETYLNKSTMFDIHYILNPCHYLITQANNQVGGFVMQTVPEEDFK